MKSYPYPLPEHALADMAHPNPAHDLAQAGRDGGHIFAGNGYIACRIHRGAWIDSEIPELSPAAKARFNKLPWDKLERSFESDGWRFLSDIRGDLFRYAPVSLWLRYNPNPSPVWRLGKLLARLSHLQHIARLPRCEVLTVHSDDKAPLFFRFSGGAGMIPSNDRLKTFSFEVFKPRYCPVDGHELSTARTVMQPLQSHLSNWPPPEPSFD